VRESKDFSVRVRRGGKVPADVVGDKRSVLTSGTEIKLKDFSISQKLHFLIYSLYVKGILHYNRT
jgi:ribosomal protein L25 (general stress protein Ctc)